MNQPDEILRTLSSDEIWICDLGGCGECTPVQKDFEYYRSETYDGQLLESRTSKVWVSNCCKGPMSVWNNRLDCHEEDYDK